MITTGSSANKVLSRWMSGRELTTYPSKWKRIGYFSIVVLAVVAESYAQYVPTTVQASVVAQLHMSFSYQVGILVVGVALGAVASFLSGVADRFGRANFIVVGIAVSSTVNAVAVPAATSRFAYGALLVLAGTVDGAVTVASVALTRDLSAQRSRGVTVALWVVGPVAGRLIATEVSSHTLRHLHPWQDQFHIASIVSWTTAFTETVEQRNPALVATGMSTSEWCGRIVAGLVLVMLTFVVTSSGPIFDYGPTLAAIRTSYPAQVATLQAIDSSTLTELPSPGRSPSTVNSAVSQLERSFGLGAPGALVCLAALSKVPKADLAYLGAHGAAVATARRQSRSQWSEWWWLTFGSELLFVPTLLALTGRWAPRSARADIEAHKKMIEPEIRAVEGLL